MNPPLADATIESMIEIAPVIVGMNLPIAEMITSIFITYRQSLKLFQQFILNCLSVGRELVRDSSFTLPPQPGIHLPELPPHSDSAPEVLG